MDEESPPPPGSRFRRRALITVSCLLAGLILAGFAGWYYRLALAERVILAVLEARGIAPASLTVTRLSVNSASLSEVTLGPGPAQRIERIDVTYSPAALYRGEVTGIHVESLRLDGRLVDGRVNLPGLDELFRSGSSGDAPPLRIGRLSAEDFGVALATPYGDISLTGGATATTSVEGLVDITATYAVAAANSPNKVHATGRATATLLPTGEVIGRITLDNGRARIAEDTIEGLHGEAQLLGHGGNFSVDATLNATGIHFRGAGIGHATLSAGLAFGDSGIRVDTRLDAADSRGALTGTVQPNPDGGFGYDGTLTLRIDLPEIQGQLDSTLSASVDAAKNLSGRLAIAEASLSWRDIALEGVTGTADFTRTGTGQPVIDATVDFRRLSLPGIDAAAGKFALRHDATETAANGEAVWQGGRFTFDAALPPDRPLRFSTQGKLDPSALLTALAMPLDAAGVIAFDLSGTLAEPHAMGVRLTERLTAAGSVTGELQDLQYPEILHRGRLDGKIAVDLRPGSWILSSQSVALNDLALAPATLLRLPDSLRQHGATSMSADLTGMAESEAVLRITPATEGYTAKLTGRARLASRHAALTVSGKLEALLNTDGGVSAVPLAGGRVALKGVHVQPVADFVDPVTLRPDITGNLALRDGILTLETRPNSRLVLDGLLAPGLFQTVAPLTLATDSAFRIRVDTKRQPLSVSYNGMITLTGTELSIRAGDNPVAMKLSDIPVRITGGSNNILLSTGPASLDIPDYALMARDITLNLTAADDIAVDATIAEIRHRDPEPVVIPLKLALTGRLKGDQATFSARLHNPAETLSIRASGKHDITLNAGSAHIESDRITFLPTVLAPKQLFPIAGNRFRNVDGQLDSKAGFRWADGKLDSTAEILVNLSTLETDELQLENAATVIVFDSLLPLSTPPAQEVHVGRLDIGIPLTGGRIEFEVRRNGSVSAALRELDLFGGRIETAPFTIPASLDGFTVPLQVNGVKLESVLAATKSGELTATGTLNGEIPVVFENGAILLRNGYLETAEGGGTIRYRPEAVGDALSEANEGTALFLEIVNDFQYDSVRVTIDEEPSGDIPFHFKIKGRNQTVYNGIPVELNLTMSGPLRAILQQGLKTYSLPNRLLERMQDFVDK